MKLDINKALERIALQEIDDQIDNLNYQMVTQIAVTLHRFYDFNDNDLREFFDRLTLIQKETTERFELDKDDTIFCCEYYLKDNHINIPELTARVKRSSEKA